MHRYCQAMSLSRSPGAARADMPISAGPPRPPQRTIAVRDQVRIALGLDAMQFDDILVRQQGRTLTGTVKGADPLLSTRRLQQFPVDPAAPAPIESHLSERIIERAPMNLFGLRKCTVNIKDQRARTADHPAHADKIDRRRRRLAIHPVPSPAPAATTNTRLAS